MAEKRTLLDTLLFEKSNKVSGGIYHKMQVDFTYNSNHMEAALPMIKPDIYLKRIRLECRTRRLMLMIL